MTFHPEQFQGASQLDKSTYFEGWYFKHTSPNLNISFIPGIHIENGSPKAFIQIITNTHSYYINYPFSAFSYSQSPFSVTIGDSIFSLDGCHLKIVDATQNLFLSGKLEYSNMQYITTSLFSPTIMGPFSYLPFLECNHGVLEMKNTVKGSLTLNENNYCFDFGIGYIEKDWGTSFPQSYIWCQANHFSDTTASFFLSIATIPIGFIRFTGFICSFILDNKEYRFATYNGSKIIKYEVHEQQIDVILKHKDVTLSILSQPTNGLLLKAPKKGQMSKDIYETIQATLCITLKQKEHILFSQTSTDGGLEIATY